jgi:adenylate cyclase
MLNMSMLDFRNSLVLRVIGIGLLASLAIIAIRTAGWLESAEMVMYDWALSSRPIVDQADPHIVLITITEEDIQKMGHWPLSDKEVAQIIELLTDKGARAIGLDIYRDIEVPPGRESLNRLLVGHREIITVMKFPDQDSEGIQGPNILQETDQIGFNDFMIDAGGTVRRGFLYLENEDGVATSFALLLALRYLEHQGIGPRPDPINPEFIRLGRTTIRPLNPNDGSYVNADMRGYQFLLKFAGGSSPFTKYSLNDLRERNIPSQGIAGKVVLIGMVADSVGDHFFTPFSRGLKVEGPISGIELHGHIVRQLLQMALDDDPPIQFLPDEGEWGWILLWGVFGGLIGLRTQTPWRFAGFIIAGGGTIGVIGYLALLNNWWIPLFSPILAWTLSGSLGTALSLKIERQERDLLMRLFGQHVDEEIADNIWQERHQILTEGRIPARKLTVTILFADMEGFTSVAERLSPQDLMNWLNTYMEALAGVVRKHKGIIDDYYGDGVKVNFGVPLPRTTDKAIGQDAINAVQCGLAMRREVMRLNETRGHPSFPVVRIRIGIATGPVVAGSLGSADRLKYTTMGDTVNVAARLEQLGKEARDFEKESEGGTLLIGETTCQYLDASWSMKQVGEVLLRGKKEGVNVYQILDGPMKTPPDL